MKAEDRNNSRKKQKKKGSHVIRWPLFRLRWRLFAFFQLDTVVTTLTPLSPCSSPFFCSLSAIVLVHLRSPFLYVHVCYIHLGSFLQYVRHSARICSPSRVLWMQLICLVYRIMQTLRSCRVNSSQSSIKQRRRKDVQNEAIAIILKIK